ncbi:carbamate kinase [candidate division KSB1 bacterium]|nr:carbamate kinase [candidate division KSB1 bacterium]
MHSLHNSETRIAVIALGGNAITREFEEGDIYQQFANTRRALIGVADLIERGYRVAVTHGNGPQVGHALIRVEETRHIVPPVPLGVLVADLEGGMGYMIEQTLQNKLKLRGIRRDVITLLSQVVVDKDDHSILNPTKFVGPFYKKEDVERLERERGYMIKEDPGRGYRRVVPSPLPRRIVEAMIIKRLVHDGVVVITVGGGGIPVYVESDGRLEGVDAVIDKDRASAILAKEIEADELYILTAVDKVALNYGTPQETPLDLLTVSQARRYLDEQQFPAGSMGPKIEAAIDFIAAGGKRVIISSVERMPDAIQGRTGTVMVK